MSFLPLNALQFADGPVIDPFSRLRVSQVSSLFDYQAQYNTGPRDWSGLATGTGTITHLPNESSVELSTGGTASGAKYERQTRLCWRYQSGKGQQIFQTFLFGAAVNNVRRQIGYFDAGNGIFLQQTISALSFVQRSSVSGAPVDMAVAQADWSLDKLDGTGPSGQTLDITKTQLVFFDLQWLGVGRVRCGFFIDGKPVIAHEFDNGNSITSVYMTTANLPMRGVIENTDVASGTNTMKMICSSVMSEGGDEAFQRGNLNSAATGTTTIAVTTRRPIISVRPAANFNGIPNRAWYILIEALMRVTTNDLYWEVVFGATLTGAAFAAAAADSCVEFDTSATTLSGGTSVVKGYAVSGVGAASGSNIAAVAGRFPNSVDSLLGTQTAHTLVGTSMTGTSNVAAAINWREIY